MQNRKERDPRYLAWLIVLAVHGGLFWLLTAQRDRTTSAHEEPRLRLTWIRPPAPPVVAPLQPAPAKVLPVAPVAPRVRAAAIRVEVQAPPPMSTPAANVDLLQQGRQWAQQQAQADPVFAQNPLHSRRAQLPGGENGGAFRMKEPMSPARAMQYIATAFGDPGPPCPRVKAGIQGLLTATSDKERALLHEELRRERQFCQP